MKWYFALNEAGINGAAGLHAKLAVQSAQERTSLKPIMLYIGRSNSFTDWMIHRGVTVLNVKPTYHEAMERAIQSRLYPEVLKGHWLRTEIPLLEKDEDFVLYTDIDVVFLSDPMIADINPKLLACAPEMNRDDTVYINSGIMVLNVNGMREDYDAFRKHIESMFSLTEAQSFNDQHAYNDHYSGRHEPLSLDLNWKPYWGASQSAQILYFHGPKLPYIISFHERGWITSNDFETLMKEIFFKDTNSYQTFCRSVVADIGPKLDPEVLDMLRKIIEMDVSGITVA